MPPLQHPHHFTQVCMEPQEPGNWGESRMKGTSTLSWTWYHGAGTSASPPSSLASCPWLIWYLLAAATKLLSPFPAWLSVVIQYSYLPAKFTMFHALNGYTKSNVSQGLFSVIHKSWDQRNTWFTTTYIKNHTFLITVGPVGPIS